MAIHVGGRCSDALLVESEVGRLSRMRLIIIVRKSSSRGLELSAGRHLLALLAARGREEGPSAGEGQRAASRLARRGRGGGGPPAMPRHPRAFGRTHSGTRAFGSASSSGERSYPSRVPMSTCAWATARRRPSPMRRVTRASTDSGRARSRFASSTPSACQPDCPKRPRKPAHRSSSCSILPASCSDA